MDDNGGFLYVNVGQKPRWGKAKRPDHTDWTGTIHRAGCVDLGPNQRLANASERRTLQTCLKCKGDGRPYRQPVPSATSIGCEERDREHHHPRHMYKRITGTRVRCPGWPDNSEDTG